MLYIEIMIKIPRKKKKAFKKWFSKGVRYTVAPNKKVTSEGIYEEMFYFFRTMNSAKKMFTTECK